MVRFSRRYHIAEIDGFFARLFTSSNLCRIEKELMHIQSCVPQNMMDDLVVNVSLEEVRIALFQMAPLKALIGWIAYSFLSEVLGCSGRWHS